MANPSLMYMIFLTLIGLFSLTTLIGTLKRVVQRNPVLVINSNELIDKISIAKVGSIPWKQVKSVKIDKYLNREHILIAISNSQEIIDKLPYFKRKMVEQQFLDTGAVIVIDPKMINGNPKDIVTKIKNRMH